MTKDTITRREALAVGAAGLAAGALGTGAARAQGTGGLALVTGCSSGFGRLSALELARAGIPTLATMREPEGANAEAAAELMSVAEGEGLPLEVAALDVRNTPSVVEAVAAAEALGPLEMVVNNAGYILAGSIELHDEADVIAQFDITLVGDHRLIRAALPGMRARRRGLVMQVSSGLGRIVFPTQGWYVATKFAIEGMSEALAYELAPLGVELTIVQPTQYATQFLPNGRRYFEDLVTRIDSERAEAYAEQIGMTRFGLQDDPEAPDARDVALAIRELAEMETGRRPLRRIVSPEPFGLEQINGGLAAAQDAVFDGSPFAEWRAAVTD